MDLKQLINEWHYFGNNPPTWSKKSRLDSLDKIVNAHQVAFPIISLAELTWIPNWNNPKDLEFLKWHEYLTKLTCSFFGITPSELNNQNTNKMNTINCKVVMQKQTTTVPIFPAILKSTTDKKTFDGSKLMYWQEYYSPKGLMESGWEPQHLYITSDREIQIGDFFIGSDLGNRQVVVQCTESIKSNAGGFPLFGRIVNGHSCASTREGSLKIEATTDKSLGLPGISKEWLEAYAKKEPREIEVQLEKWKCEDSPICHSDSNVIIAKVKSQAFTKDEFEKRVADEVEKRVEEIAKLAGDNYKHALEVVNKTYQGTIDQLVKENEQLLKYHKDACAEQNKSFKEVQELKQQILKLEDDKRNDKKLVQFWISEYQKAKSGTVPLCVLNESKDYIKTLQTELKCAANIVIYNQEKVNELEKQVATLKRIRMNENLRYF